MVSKDLILDINKKDLSIFKKDFIQLMRVAYGMNDYYVKANPIATKYMPKYKSLIKSFNKKYPSLKLKLIEKYELNLKIFFKTKKSLKDIFLESASKIAGLKSIGSEGFEAAEISESEKFYNELEKVKNKIYLTYHGEKKILDTLILKLNKKSKMIEIEYEIEDMLNEYHPNVNLCAYYALKNGYNKKIKLFEKGADFGFISVLLEEEFKNILNKFNPLMHE